MAVNPDPRLLHATEKDGLGVHNRLHIVSKELGMVAYKFMMTERFPDDKGAHLADLVVDLGDLMVQLRGSPESPSFRVGRRAYLILCPTDRNIFKAESQY